MSTPALSTSGRESKSEPMTLSGALSIMEASGLYMPAGQPCCRQTVRPCASARAHSPMRFATPPMPRFGAPSGPMPMSSAPVAGSRLTASRQPKARGVANVM